MSTNAIGNILLFVVTKGMQLTARFAAMLADEYKLIFISLSAHIQLTEFYQLLLLSSSLVFQSAAAPGWTLIIPAQQQALAVIGNAKQTGGVYSKFLQGDT